MQHCKFDEQPTSLCGSCRMISLSLHVPGSPSSALTTRYLGRPSSGLFMKLHLSPEGNPAPPLPRSPLALISFTIHSLPFSTISCTHFQHNIVKEVLGGEWWVDSGSRDDCGAGFLALYKHDFGLMVEWRIHNWAKAEERFDEQGNKLSLVLYQSPRAIAPLMPQSWRP